MINIRFVGFLSMISNGLRNSINGHFLIIQWRLGVFTIVKSTSEHFFPKHSVHISQALLIIRMRPLNAPFLDRTSMDSRSLMISSRSGWVMTTDTKKKNPPVSCPDSSTQQQSFGIAFAFLCYLHMTGCAVPTTNCLIAAYHGFLQPIASRKTD